MGEPLPPGLMLHALAVIRAWREDPDAPCPCPVCGARELAIIDRSARPLAEWYALSCPACGLDDSISIPMSGPSSFTD